MAIHTCVTQRLDNNYLEKRKTKKGMLNVGTLPFNLIFKNTQGHNGNAIGQPGQAPGTAKFNF